MFQSPADVAFSFFGFSVYYYGIILAFAIFVGFYVAYFLYKKFYGVENSQKIIDFFPYLIILGILGARLYYCLVNYQYYAVHPLEILYIRQGGLSIHGMIGFGILLLYVFSKIYKMSFLKLSDVFLCGTSLAQSIGRWGNFFNSEAFGLPTDLPWKLFIPISQRPLEYISYEYFHPTFLYESILDLLIFIILLLFFKKLSKTSGVIACLYLILYSVARIFVEHFRIDSAMSVLGYPIAQVVSFFTIIIAIMFLIILLIRKR